LGNAFKRQGKLSEAIASYQTALQIKPDFEEAQNNMGNAYSELGDHNNAVSCYQSALQINPDNADAHNNLANVRKEQGKLEEAITNYQKAIELKADNAQAHNNMGIALKELGRLDGALRCFQKALQINPDLVEVHNNMGVTFKELGRLDEALACYRKSLQMRPDAGIEIRTALMLPVIYDSVSSLHRIRQNMDERINLMKTKSVIIDDPFKQIGTTNFYLAYHGLNNRHLQKKTAALHMHACPQLNCELIDSQFNPAQHARIKIGVISKFLYAHTIGRLNHGIIKNLDRQKFDVTVFRIPGPIDRVSEAIDRSADKVVVLPSRLESARQIIADQKLDILFYLDIGMDPLTYFLAFTRLAPIQCTTWGHPDTSGIPNMDYYISSAAAEPRGAQNHYSEQLVLLNKFAMYCKKPPPVQHIISKQDLGIPEDCHLYACVQSVFKVHPDFDLILGTILRQDPKALIVFFEAKHGHWTKLLNKRFKRTLPDVHHRIAFLKRLPEKDFQSFLPVADVLLDTPRFNGGYTSLLSFAGGVPIVTRPGEFMRGRLTYAFYRQMGIMDCVADNNNAYAALALRLANDKAWNTDLRAKIKARAHVLFDDLQPVRELEFFFKWARTAYRKASIQSYNE
jgi:predicted O-linked N-acetylglucosamine transferase (SPINDLY family)